MQLMKRTKITLTLIIITLSIICIAIPFAIFILKFHQFPLSKNPADWYDFLPIMISLVNLSITGIIAWQVQAINRKNSRRNSVLQYLGEVYIDFDNCADNYLGKITAALLYYNFTDVPVYDLMDKFENELKKLRSKCFAFYNDESSESFAILLNLVRDFNGEIRIHKETHDQLNDELLFRDQVIIDSYIKVDQRYKKTKLLMKKYMND
jgi:hypothetical protein